MVEPNRIQEVSDHLEIQGLLTRYCTAIDSKQYDMLDTVFTPDAFIDYRSAGGISGKLPEIKAWLAKALGVFPMTQHYVTNFSITLDGDSARSRCMFYNPMGLSLQEGRKGLELLFFGGYYNDKLVRTPEGWRISERIEESTWMYGQLPKGFEIPQ